MTLAERGGPGSGCSGRDPIGEYLGEKLRDVREPFPEQAAPVRRRSLAKIAGLAAAGLLVVAGGAWVVSGLLASAKGAADSRITGGTDQGEVQGRPSTGQDEAGAEVGRVVLVHGSVGLLRGHTRSTAAAGDALREGDAVVTADDSAAGLSLTASASRASLVVLGGSSRMRVAVASHASVPTPAPVSSNTPTVVLEQGNLAASVSQGDTGGGGPRFETSSAVVTCRDAVLALEAGREGALVGVSVAEGEATVLRKQDGKAFRVGRGWSLDGRTWSLAPGEPEERIIARLEALVALERAFEDEDDGDGGTSAGGGGSATAAGAGGAKHDGLVARIRQALADGDVDLAIDLVEIEGAGRKDAAFLVAAADAYREAGKWKSAADTYVSAAGGTDGKEAERVLLRAAEIKLRKLGDAAGAVAVIEEYLERFPAGVYLDEGLYLAAAIRSKLGDKARARESYEAYLAKFPDGVQAVKAHVALAQILAGGGGGGGGAGGKGKDCAGAMAHVAAAAGGGKAVGPALAAEIAKVEAVCGKGGEQ